MSEVNQIQQTVSAMPVAQLRTNRGLLKTILLSAITFGIYGLVVQAHIAEDTNVICSRYDGQKTMNFWLLFFLVGPVTLQIATIVWTHKICNRIGAELTRRNVDFKFSASTFWLWNVLGALIIIGPFVFLYKWYKAMNMLNEDYNKVG